MSRIKFPIPIKKKKFALGLHFRVYNRHSRTHNVVRSSSRAAYVNRESPWPSSSAQPPIYSQFHRSMLQPLNAKEKKKKKKRLHRASPFSCDSFDVCPFIFLRGKIFVRIARVWAWTRCALRRKFTVREFKVKRKKVARRVWKKAEPERLVHAIRRVDAGQNDSNRTGK